MCNNSCQRTQSAPITSKAEALQFAILTTAKVSSDGHNEVDYEEAKKLFDFICANASFPEDERNVIIKNLAKTIEGFKETINPCGSCLLSRVEPTGSDDPLKDAMFNPRKS